MTAAATVGHRTELVFTITFHGPFRVARGEASGGADLTVDRQTPLPASSIKGLMRAAAEHVLRIPEPWLMAVFGADTGGDQAGPGLGGVLDQWCWSDPEIGQGLRTIDRAARIRLQPDGTVMDRHLLVGEQVWVHEPVPFTVTRLGPVHPADLDAHRLILRASARAVLALGGQRRRGFGWVTISAGDGEVWTDVESRALLAIGQRSPSPVGSGSGGAATILAPQPRNPLVHLTYRLRLRSAVTAGAGAEVGNGQRGHLVIPGSVVRGALAAAWLREHGPADADDRMAALFERDLSVGPAVPVGSRLIPLSQFRRKYPEPGVSNEWDDAAAHAVDPPGQGLEFGRGWQVPTEYTVRITRTALDPDGTAKTGNLFSETGLRAGVVAVGELRVRTDDAAALDWLRRPRTLRVGGRRSTAGAADWAVHDDAVGEHTPTDPGAVGVTTLVRCLSPLILVDAFGAPAADHGTVEVALTQAAGQRLRLRRQWVRTRTVEGWHTASGLPKVAEWAIEAGSVFEVDGMTDAVRERLEAGVGLRRQEGFGRVEVCTAGAVAPPVADPTPGEPRAAATPSPVVDPSHLVGDSRSDPVAVAGPPPEPPEPPRLASPVVTGHAEPADRADRAAVPAAATPATTQAATPVTAPPTAPVEQRVADLIAAVGPAAVSALLRGLLSEARRIANYRASGMDAVATGAARSALKQAWAREHSTAVQDLISGLLLDENVSRVRDVVSRRSGEQG